MPASHTALLEGQRKLEVLRVDSVAMFEEDRVEPMGPTLRDVTGSDEILIGRIQPDASLPVGEGWRLWVAYDPLRLAADQALRQHLVNTFARSASNAGKTIVAFQSARLPSALA